MGTMTENIIGKGGSTMDVKLSTDKTVFRLLVKDLGYKGEGDRTLAGRAYFKDRNGERIFYHSEIADKFKGRGIGRILVEESLKKTQEYGKVVVPICPIYVKFLQEDGEKWKETGLKFREATEADRELVAEDLKAAEANEEDPDKREDWKKGQPASK